MLEHIFGKLAIKSSGSSAAGLRQAIGNSSKIVLCDEFEDSKHRAETLQMIRASGRGDKILRGTTNQHGTGFGLKHIVWVAAIEVHLNRAPDKNRFIRLELSKAAAADRSQKLKLPSSGQLADLGQRLLAVAIRYAIPVRGN